MIGCLAGLMTKRAGRPAGDQRRRRPGHPVGEHLHRRVSSAGAKRCNKNINVLIDFSQDFGRSGQVQGARAEPDREGLEGRSSRSPAVAASVLSTLPREKGRWGIGVDKDQSDLGRHILTSAVKRVDTAVFLTAQSAKSGKFKGGVDAVFNLRNNGVAVGKISSRVPKAFITQMNALRPLLISGKIKAPKSL